MSYPTYLIHFNKNHSSKNGQFVSGDGDGDGIVDDHKNQLRKSGKKLYSKISREKNKVRSVLVDKYSDSDEINELRKDKRIIEARKNLKNTKYDMPEYPDWDTDKETISIAKKQWKNDWGFDYDPDNPDHDHKLFDYYLDSASEKSKTYQKKLQEYTEAFVQSNWEKAYDDYSYTRNQVVDEFVNKYADKEIYGTEYHYLVREMLDRDLYE